MIAEGTNNQHINVKELVKDYKKEFSELGTLSVLNRESTGGRPEQYFLLNEQQAYLHLQTRQQAGIQPKKRDSAGIEPLTRLYMIEGIIEDSIRDGITQVLFYKDIYKACKARLEQFTDITYLTSGKQAIN